MGLTYLPLIYLSRNSFSLQVFDLSESDLWEFWWAGDCNILPKCRFIRHQTPDLTATNHPSQEEGGDEGHCPGQEISGVVKVWRGQSTYLACDGQVHKWITPLGFEVVIFIDNLRNLNHGT